MTTELPEIQPATPTPAKLRPTIGSDVRTILEIGAHDGRDTLRFLTVAGLEMTTIPYNGSPDAVAALLRGDVQLFWVGLSILKSHIEAGRVAAVAVATRERTALAPEVPTVREQGLDYEGGLSSYVVFGPPGMRRDLVEFLHKKIAETLGNAVLRERVKPIGYALLTATAAPEEISVLLSREVRAMKDSAASVGLKPQ